MHAIARMLQIYKGLFQRQAAWRTADRHRRFFQARGWETTCGGYQPVDEAPDRLVFLVSLIILPIILFL
ncbi:MAG: hypothetical protein KGZ83_12045 [Sulfuricella sp.]|nr:hypothetical protein [Sulfuricella sp.]